LFGYFGWRTFYRKKGRKQMKNADLLLRIGHEMYSGAKKFIFFAPGGFFCLFITMLFCGKYATAYLLFSGHYASVNFLVFAWYVIIAIGLCAVFPYFIGLILIGLGQIAANTYTATNSDTTTPAPQPATLNHQSPANKVAQETRKAVATNVPSSAQQSHDQSQHPTDNEHSDKYWTCGKCGSTNLHTRNHCWSCGTNK